MVNYTNFKLTEQKIDSENGPEVLDCSLFLLCTEKGRTWKAGTYVYWAPE